MTYDRKIGISALMAAGMSTALLATSMAQAEEAGNQSDMVKKGSVNLDFRYRFEYVDQDGIDEEAEASTLETVTKSV